MKNDNKLDITFHNPNTEEQVTEELLKIFAEIAAKKVKEEMKKSALKDLKQQETFSSIAV